MELSPREVPDGIVGISTPPARAGWSLLERLRLFIQFARLARNWYTLAVPILGFDLRPGVTYILRSGVKIKTRSGPLRSHLGDCYAIIENFGSIRDTVFREIGPGHSVMDIGAHVGAFTIRASSVARKVYAFEPHPDNFAFLRENLLLNDRRNVQVKQVALGSTDGQRLIYAGDSGTKAGFYAAGMHSRVVDTVCLGTALRLCGEDTIDWAKLDCEGAEYEIVLSSPVAVLQRIRAYFIELHHRANVSSSIAKLLRTLRDAGFSVTIDHQTSTLIARQQSVDVSGR